MKSRRLRAGAFVFAVLYAWICWGASIRAFAKAWPHAPRAAYAVTVSETACECPMNHTPGVPCCCKHMQDDAEAAVLAGEHCIKLRACPGHAPAPTAAAPNPDPHIPPVSPAADLPRPAGFAYVTFALRLPQATLDSPEKIPI